MVFLYETLDPHLVPSTMAVAAALDSSSAGVSGREQDDEAAEAAQRDIESNQASLVAKCSMMLKALE